jgi:hypothetical protein
VNLDRLIVDPDLRVPEVDLQMDFVAWIGRRTL